MNSTSLSVSVSSSTTWFILRSFWQTLAKWFLPLHFWHCFPHAGHFFLFISCLFPQKWHVFVTRVVLSRGCSFRSFLCFRSFRQDLPLPRVESSTLFTVSKLLPEAISFICELVASLLRQMSMHFSNVSLRSWSNFCLVCLLCTPNTILSLTSESCRDPKLQVLARFLRAET